MSDDDLWSELDAEVFPDLELLRLAKPTELRQVLGLHTVYVMPVEFWNVGTTIRLVWAIAPSDSINVVPSMPKFFADDVEQTFSGAGGYGVFGGMAMDYSLKPPMPIGTHIIRIELEQGELAIELEPS